MEDSLNVPASEVLKNEAKESDDSTVFKKPIFIGKIGKGPKKILCGAENQEGGTQDKDTATVSPINVPYKEPVWSGTPPPDSGYTLEVLKSGMIIESVNLTSKPYYVFGRLAVDIVMAHPTVSRYHAVIQYKAQESEGDNHPIGWYIFDLDSSHGTFLNKNRVKPNQYVQIQVGHLVRFGCSTRQFILQGPEDDIQAESEFSLTEMKKLKLAKKLRMEKESYLIKFQEEEKTKKEEESGISWGMADDAMEETDLTDNPYATTNNEELYLDDPKKTLRGFFEREGVPLEYHCEEKGIGQFLCKVELPIEDMTGKSIMAEVIHKGKKKDAVVQCALEACRIIDRHGLLRQAKHESRKRKEKDWQENDFYDSDEDTFLDRTGAVEKKRKERIKKYKGEKDIPSVEQSNKAFTYEELLKKCNSIQGNIDIFNERLGMLRNHGKKEDGEEEEEDELDKFMKGLDKQSVADKAEISKAKMEIQILKQELTKTQKLADIAKPVNIPPLIKSSDASDTNKGLVIKKTSTSVVIGKRIKLQNRVQTPYKLTTNVKTLEANDSEEEFDSDEEVTNKSEDLYCSGVERLCETSSTSADAERETIIHGKNPNNELKVSERNAAKEKQLLKETDNAMKKSYGPMRPPEGYVVPENYFDQENDRDLPEIAEESEY